MQLGWGYAMLGPPAWAVMLRVIERPPAVPAHASLTPLLLGAGVVCAVVSAFVPAIVSRSKELRALFLPKTTPGPDASDEERTRAKELRDARAYEIYLVSWVLSLKTAVIPGMLGLVLGYLSRDQLPASLLIAAAFVLTALRFPSERAVREAVDRW
jgi:hypothetical protein